MARRHEPCTLPLLAVLVALLVGLAVGKAWERYKLRDGRWIDRRRLRETPHYMLGLNFLVDNQVDQAIDELTQATSTDTDALEIQMILGNLYRQKGQVGRAINVHQALLQRPDLTHARARLRAALPRPRLPPRRLRRSRARGVSGSRAARPVAIVTRWSTCRSCTKTSISGPRPRACASRSRAIDARRREEDQQILGFLRNEIGSVQAAPATSPARRKLPGRIDIDSAHRARISNLGDVRERQGNLAAAVEAWEKLVHAVPDRAYLAFERLERAYRPLGTPRRFADLCQRLIAPHPQDWRARLALSRHLAVAGQHRQAFDLLLDALPHNPHGLVDSSGNLADAPALGLDPGLVRRYVALTREAVFYLDPHVCVRCRYRSTELLWQCPQCHEWNTFVEERIAPAKDTTVAELSES